MTIRACCVVAESEFAHNALVGHGRACVMRFGARVEYLYRPTPPRNGGEAGRDDTIELLSHLYFANRGVLLTPFHNMALISPATTQADVERYDAVFGDLLAEFTSH